MSKDSEQRGRHYVPNFVFIKPPIRRVRRGSPTWAYFLIWLAIMAVVCGFFATLLHR